MPEPVTEADQAPPAAPEVDWRAKADVLAREARAYARQLAELKKASADELDRATQEAYAAGRAEVLRTTSRRLVAQEIHGQAARRGLSEDVADVLFEHVLVDRFLTDDGDVDTKAVTELLDAVPARQAPRRPVDFGGGARGMALPQSPGAVFGEVLRRELHG